MKLFKLFSTYTLVTIITAGIPFFIMPLLTHYLSTTDYGNLSLFNTYITISIPFISLGTTGYLSVEYFKKSKVRFQEIFSSIVRIPVIMTVIYGLFFLTFENKLSSLLEIPPKWLIAIPILAFLSIIVEILYGMLIIQKKAITYGVVSVFRMIIEVSFSLFLIISIKMDWKGRVSALIIAIFIAAIYAVYYFIKQEWLFFNQYKKNRIQQALFFGLPLIPHLVGKFIINQSDIIFIAKMISIEDAGIYRIGYQFGYIISIISGAFLYVYTPFLLERLAKITDSKKREIVKLSWVFILVLVFLTIILTLGSKFIFVHIIHKDFINGAQFVFWTALSYLFWGGYLIFAGYIFYLKKTKILGYISILNISLNLFLNYFLILKFGVIGVSYATAISFFITFVVVAFISNKLYPMPWFSFYKNKYESN